MELVGEYVNRYSYVGVYRCFDKLMVEDEDKFGNPEEGVTSAVGSRYRARTSEDRD
jgi:hypothetical protein